MAAHPRMTLARVMVLAAFLRDEPAEGRYGYEIMKASGLQPGTVYPILKRFEEAGWLTTRWENADDALAEGRPPRRYYTLTSDGRTAAAREVQKHPTRQWAVNAFLQPRPE